MPARVSIALLFSILVISSVAVYIARYPEAQNAAASGACNASIISSATANTIALDTAGLKGFGGVGQSLPQIITTTFLSQEELLANHGFPLRYPPVPCVWFVSMTGQKIGARVPPGAPTPATPVTFIELEVVIDDASSTTVSTRMNTAAVFPTATATPYGTIPVPFPQTPTPESSTS